MQESEKRATRRSRQFMTAGADAKESRDGRYGGDAMRWICAASVAAMLVVQVETNAMAEAPLPPAPDWSGRSERLIAAADNPWITPAEQSGFERTPTYDETRAWLERLAAATPLVRLETFGVSPQGRDLIAAIVSTDGAALDPEKPVLLLQAGIHSGEIDGKDAGLMLLRDIAFGGRADLIARVNLVFVPIFNVDGHERASPFNRPNQRGPNNQGWRNTAQNLNLNRDYAKADAPEMRAMIALIRRVDPDLYLDIHVTDGMDYQYDVTYGYQGSAGEWTASPNIARWLNRTYRPTLDRALRQEGHIPGDLVFAVNDRDPHAGLAVFGFSPRFSQAYGDMVHTPSVLVENHSLKPHRQRVLGTYVLIECSLEMLARHGASLRSARAQDRSARRPVAAGWQMSETPDVTRELATMQYETYLSAASGGNELHWTGQAGPVRGVPQHAPRTTVELQRPAAYWVPATKPEVIARLHAHGIAMETIDAPRTVNVELMRLRDAAAVAGVSEGRQRASAGEPAAERREEWFPAGSVRVPTDQPLGDLAITLLEPQSEDSFYAWGFFNEILQRTEYIEGYVIAPMADQMLANDPALRAAFEAKLAAEPDFAASQDARLEWFYERSPYVDDRHLLYPVGIER